jgi:hypothetical protein
MPARRRKAQRSAYVSSQPVEIEPPALRPLKVYAFDPSQGKNLGNEMTLQVRYEKLLPGPVNDRIAVVDYDGANKVFYRPVDLDDPYLLLQGGLDPSESDPRFHQQMVYAVVSETIQRFEAALGRRIHWRRDERIPGPDGRIRPGAWPGDIWRLTLCPHAMISANAAYTPSAKAILFGYFRASENNPGHNLPGQTVFTCLSHDVIVHETTHAILDGMRAYFVEQTNPEVGAFHEAFADIAALFRHFSHKEALLDTIQRTGGKLYQYHLKPDASAGEDAAASIQAEEARTNPLVELAKQFGEAHGKGRALRSALGEKPDPELATDPNLDVHDRGAILVSAIFDAYFTVYVRRTADLFRIFRAGGGSANPVELPGPLANQLAAEASRSAEQFFWICVRAIDYCPPVDITFGDYLRALISVSCDLDPADEGGIRDAFMQAFRLRGIVPRDAPYFSEDALRWPRLPRHALPPVAGLIFGDPNGLTQAEKDRNREVLDAYFKRHGPALGFQPRQYLSIPSFHPTFRIGADGRLHVYMVVEMSQKRDVPFDPAQPELGTFPLRTAATVLISKPVLSDGKEQSGEICYIIGKGLDPGSDAHRTEQQRRFHERSGLVEGSDPSRFQLDFNLLHGGI